MSTHCRRKGSPVPRFSSGQLPAGSGTTAEARAGAAGPTVLVVGSFEPRKNHLAILFAAETLWREGLRFDLVLIGGMGWGDAVPTTRLSTSPCWLGR